MIEVAIVEQIDEAMDFIRKNINVKFVITGRPQREEVWDYPLEAVREALINAVCHRDYTMPSNTEVRIYDDSLTIWNPGGLPMGITMEDLFESHKSILRNKGIGAVLYDMGLIEQWGSGISKMQHLCTNTGIPQPTFKESQKGFQVEFRKNIYTEEYLRGLGLNERQINAVAYVKEKGSINLSSFKTIIPDVSDKTLYRDLQGLVEKRILNVIGEKKGRKYKLK